MKDERKIVDESFGLRLRELRESKKLSQKELAVKLRELYGANVTQSMISKYEEFENTPRQKNENAIIKFFGMTKSQFYSRASDVVSISLALKDKMETFVKLYEAEGNAIARYQQDRLLIYQEIKKIIDGK